MEKTPDFNVLYFPAAHLKAVDVLSWLFKLFYGTESIISTRGDAKDEGTSTFVALLV